MPEQREWYSAEAFARLIGSAPDSIRTRIRQKQIPGGIAIPSMTGDRPAYKIHYPTFLASIGGILPGPNRSDSNSIELTQTLDALDRSIESLRKVAKSLRGLA